MATQNHLDDVQQVVNRFIRERDKYKPCISCGRPWDESFQAGHYYPIARSSMMRFDYDNIHGQCADCNMNRSGNLKLYRMNLIGRIGLKAVERIEQAVRVKNWTEWELRSVKAEAFAEIKMLDA